MDSLVHIGVAAANGEGQARGEATRSDGDAPTEESGALQDDEQLQLPPVSLRIKDVPSATAGVSSVHPNQTLEQAQGVMIRNGFSQLAVMTGPRELKGAVSWATIATARIARSHVRLTDVIDPFPKVVHADQELLEQISIIYDADFVFVRGSDDCICGIITTADLSRQFRDLTIPFFQLGEIERRLRHCIGNTFSLEELREATGRSKLRSTDDMMFGQYCYLLRDTEKWHRMGWELDCEMFTSDLDDVRKIRNHIMHFGAQPLTNEQEQQLRSFVIIMRHLDPQGSA